MGHSLTHSAFTQTEKLLTAICQTSISLKAFPSSLGWQDLGFGKLVQTGHQMVKQMTEKHQTVAEDVGFAKPQLWRGPEHTQAFPPQTWKHLLPRASSEDTRPSTNTRFILFVQTAPVIASWTNLERKALTSPSTCSSPSFCTSHLCWQKNL